MSDLLQQYMSKRLEEVSLRDIKTGPGPVVTISRAAGCSSQQLSRALALRLNQISNFKDWQVISKEVLQDSAQQLKLHPTQVKNIFKTKDRNMLEGVIEAFVSHEYQLERKVRNTVISVIHRFAVEGHRIILGRGGNIICSDIEKALHIRVDAPLDWKIDHVVSTKNISKEEALKYIEETERNRANFRKLIKGKQVNCDDFDITINQSKFSQDEMLEIILSALKTKKII
jgi:cytidylate kinase